MDPTVEVGRHYESFATRMCPLGIIWDAWAGNRKGENTGTLPHHLFTKWCEDFGVGFFSLR